MPLLSFALISSAVVQTVTILSHLISNEVCSLDQERLADFRRLSIVWIYAATNGRLLSCGRTCSSAVERRVSLISTVSGPSS